MSHRQVLGQHWGKKTTSDVTLYEATGNIFALLPYRVQRLDVDRSLPSATLGRPS